jgi:hypothetical protein
MALGHSGGKNSCDSVEIPLKRVGRIPDIIVLNGMKFAPKRGRRHKRAF